MWTNYIKKKKKIFSFIFVKDINRMPMITLMTL